MDRWENSRYTGGRECLVIEPQPCWGCCSLEFGPEPPHRREVLGRCEDGPGQRFEDPTAVFKRRPLGVKARERGRERERERERERDSESKRWRVLQLIVHLSSLDNPLLRQWRRRGNPAIIEDMRENLIKACIKRHLTSDRFECRKVQVLG